MQDHQDVSGLRQCFVWVGLWFFRDKMGQIIIFSLGRIGLMVCLYFKRSTQQVSIHKAEKHDGCCFLVLRVYEFIQLHEHLESPEELWDHVFSALFVMKHFESGLELAAVFGFGNRL